MQIAGHFLDDGQLLKILQSEISPVWFDHIKQTGHYLRNTVKMSRTVFPFHDPVKSAKIKLPGIRFGVNFRFLGHKNHITTCRSDISISFSGMRGYLFEIILVVKLGGIHKYADHYDIILQFRQLRTSDRCPSWRAPIVGTNPMLFPDSFNPESLRSPGQLCEILP